MALGNETHCSLRDGPSAIVVHRKSAQEYRMCVQGTSRRQTKRQRRAANANGAQMWYRSPVALTYLVVLAGWLAASGESTPDSGLSSWKQPAAAAASEYLEYSRLAVRRKQSFLSSFQIGDFFVCV